MGLHDEAYAAELVTSELATNANRYGSVPITLRLIYDRILICELADGSSTAPRLRRARGWDEAAAG